MECISRGTTQTLTFTLPEEIMIDALYITFAQGGKTVLEKSLNDVEISGETVTLPLSQADTLAFDRGMVTVQVAIRDGAGNVMRDNANRFEVKDVLKNGVI